MWSLNDFEFGKQIGEGRFGSVYIAREKQTGYKVAVKAVRKDDVIRLDMRHQLEREVRLQKYSSRHPHVLRMFACFWDSKFVYLVTEYCEGGDLSQYRAAGAANLSASLASPNQLQQKQQQQLTLVDEATVACWSRQLLEAAAFLHSHNLIHRDIKPDNIMLKRGRVKLGDFTWCVSLQPQPPFDRRRTICGTLDYLSPELVSHQPYDSHLDVWSIACVVYELLVGSPPFEHPRPVDTCLSIQRGEFSIPPGVMSDAAEHCLRSMLVVEQSQRPSSKELLRHPWIVNAPATPPSKARQRSHPSAADNDTHSAATMTTTMLTATTNSSNSGWNSRLGKKQHQQQQNNTNNNHSTSRNGRSGTASSAAVDHPHHHELDVSRALELDLSGIDPASISRITDAGS